MSFSSLNFVNIYAEICLFLFVFQFILHVNFLFLKAFVLICGIVVLFVDFYFSISYLVCG